MVTRNVLILLVTVSVVEALSCAALSEGPLLSIGIRFILPFTGDPFLIGIEATTGLPFGIGAGSFLLDAEGRTLITIGADINLGEGERNAETYLRLTTGLYYFEPGRFLPSLMIGGGISYRFFILRPFVFGLASEFLYPVAFPVPMFSASAGWSFR